MERHLILTPIVVQRSTKRTGENAKRRKSIDNQTKLEILEKHFKNKEKVAALARQYEVCRTSIVRWKKKYERVKEQAAKRPTGKKLYPKVGVLKSTLLEHELFK